MVALRSRKSREAGVLTATQDSGAGQEAPRLWTCAAAGQLWPRQQEAGWRQRAREDLGESGFEQLSYQMMRKGKQAAFRSM